MKISNWLGYITAIAIIVCLGLHARTLHTHEQRMNVLSCKIDLLNKTQVERPSCLDTLTK